MTKGELLEILKSYPNDSEILIELGSTKVKPLAMVLWSPQSVPHPTKIYLRPENDCVHC